MAFGEMSPFNTPYGANAPGGNSMLSPYRQAEANAKRSPKVRQHVRSAESRIIPEDKPRPRWPKNTTVLSSTTQGTLSWGSYYSDALLHNLNHSGSMLAAQKQLEKTGFLIPTGNGRQTPQIPVSSKGRPWTNAGWQKGQRKTRNVLIIKGSGKNRLQDQMLDAQVSNYQQTLQQQYGGDIHFTVLDQPNPAQVQQAFRQMKGFSDHNRHAEAMVVCLGHGGIQRPGNLLDRKYQGASEGNIELQIGPQGQATSTLSENHMKHMFHQYMGGYDAVNLVMVPCHSGAWVG